MGKVGSVAYQSLYRKYRPQRFSELVGQGHVTNALRNAVRDERVGHAYLFSGPRGTGKTTTARILAKALNCLHLEADGEPCGTCDNCVGIAQGTFLDLIEIDAASNRGVEDARRLRERVATGLGIDARRKVYLLDEAHMLTTDASNTLLKTLEEPPAHVVFVLATTSPEQVLPTIRSRSQHFEFTLLTTEQLEARLADLLNREGVAFEADAVSVIARAGAGSVRDAESLLDQALAHSPERLGAEAVSELFGGTPAQERIRILEAIRAEDAADALTAFGTLLDAGHEPRRIAEDLLVVARDAFVLTAGANRVPVDGSAEEREQLTVLGEGLGNAALVRVIETVGQAIVDMRGTDVADPRLVLEVALVRLSRRDAGPPLQTIIERLERLERAVASDQPTALAAATPTEPSARSPRKTIGSVRRASATSASNDPTPESPAVAPDEPDAHTGKKAEPEKIERTPIDLDDVIVAWGALLPALPIATRNAVQSAQPLRIDGDVIVFGVAPSLLAQARERFRREADAVRAALAQHLGRRVKFSLVAHEEFTLTGELPAERSSTAERTTGEPAVLQVAEPIASDDRPSEPEEMEMVDLHDVVDAPTVDVAPPVNLLRDQLGATVIEEVPRT